MNICRPWGLGVVMGGEGLLLGCPGSLPSHSGEGIPPGTPKRQVRTGRARATQVNFHTIVSARKQTTETRGKENSLETYG